MTFEEFVEKCESIVGSDSHLKKVNWATTKQKDIDNHYKDFDYTYHFQREGTRLIDYVGLPNSHNHYYNRTSEIPRPIPALIQVVETGGASGGSCWNDDEPEEYSTGKSLGATWNELVDILSAVAPTMTLFDYLNIQKLIRYMDYTEFEYYGNNTTYNVCVITLGDLYVFLKNKEYIES